MRWLLVVIAMAGCRSKERAVLRDDARGIAAIAEKAASDDHSRLCDDKARLARGEKQFIAPGPPLPALDVQPLIDAEKKSRAH